MNLCGETLTCSKAGIHVLIKIEKTDIIGIKRLFL